MSKKSTPYAVGDKQPPKHSRYKKGKSGNPSGRPKGQPSVQTLMLREAVRIVTIKDGDKVEKITKHEVVIRQLWRQSMKGELAAMRLLLQFMASAPVNPGGDDPEGEAHPLLLSATPDDDSIRRMMARFAHLQADEAAA